MMAMKKGFELLRSSLYRDAKEEAYMPRSHALADEAVAQAVERGDDVFTSRDFGFLEEHAMRLTKMRAEAEELAQRLQTMADRVFGADGKEDTGPRCVTPPASCNATELMGLSTAVSAAMSRASYAMERLEKL